MMNTHSNVDCFRTHADASAEEKRQYYRAIGLAAVAAALNLEMSPAETMAHDSANHIAAFLLSEDIAA